MKNCIERLAGVCIAALLCTVTMGAPTANAATVNLFASSSAGGSDTMFQPSQTDTKQINEETLDQRRIVTSATAEGNQASGKSSATASADATVGELKISAIAESSSNVGGLGGGNSFVTSSITQRFSASGTGTFTALMSLDVFWASSGFNFSAQVILSGGGLGFGVVPGVLQLDPLTNGANGRIDDLLLSSSFSLSEGTAEFDVIWQLNAQIFAEVPTTPNGLLDASNTGLISFITDGTLVATPTTTGFLSNPSFPATGPVTPVPLPASLPLLLLGGATLAATRRRQRHSGPVALRLADPHVRNNFCGGQVEKKHLISYN